MEEGEGGGRKEGGREGKGREGGKEGGQGQEGQGSLSTSYFNGLGMRLVVAWERGWCYHGNED